MNLNMQFVHFFQSPQTHSLPAVVSGHIARSGANVTYLVANRNGAFSN